MLQLQGQGVRERGGVVRSVHLPKAALRPPDRETRQFPPSVQSTSAHGPSIPLLDTVPGPDLDT
eukprot:882272-Rhodomonas_salina.2